MTRGTSFAGMTDLHSQGPVPSMGMDGLQSPVIEALTGMRAPGMKPVFPEVSAPFQF